VPRLLVDEQLRLAARRIHLVGKRAGGLQDRGAKRKGSGGRLDTAASSAGVQHKLG
jgi:hypothetical protein